MRLSNVFVQRRSLLQVEQLDVVVPGPVGGDIRRHGVEVDALRGEDHAVLALIDGDLDRPVGHDVKALLIQGLAVGLVGGLGTVKETITQVSRSKKWESKPVLDENGNPMLNAKGKKILKSSYSVLQDDFFNFMRNAGYTDVERGECGSTEEHLTVTQFKVQAEQQRLEAVTGQVAQAEQSLADAKAATEKQKKKLEALKKETQAAKSVAMTAHEIESMGKKNPITGNVTMTADECRTLKDYAVSSFAEKSEKLKYKQKFEQADKNAKIWKDRFEKLNKDYEELKQKAQPFLDAIEIASEKVWAFINAILARGKELYEHKHPARNRGQDMEI